MTATCTAAAKAWGVGATAAGPATFASETDETIAVTEAPTGSALDAYAPRIPYYRVRAADPSIGPFSEWREREGL